MLIRKFCVLLCSYMFVLGRLDDTGGSRTFPVCEIPCFVLLSSHYSVVGHLVMFIHCWNNIL